MNHNKLFSIIFSATAVCLPIAANGTAIGHDTVTETDFKTKEAYTGDSLATAWLNAQTGLTPEERDAIKFLYAYMPLADGNGYAPEFFLANVRSSLRAAEEMPWGKTVPTANSATSCCRCVSTMRVLTCRVPFSTKS